MADPSRTGRLPRSDVPADQTVLIVGGAGMLGSRIAAHLIDEPATRVRLMVRDADLASVRNPDFVRVRERGAEVFEGHLSTRSASSAPQPAWTS